MGEGSVAAPALAMSPLNVERGEERWRHFDNSVNAVSFGFVATAVLISMFLLMAIFERFLRPTSSSSTPQTVLSTPGGRRSGRGTTWLRQWWWGGNAGADLEAAAHRQQQQQQQQGGTFAGKLDYPSPKMSIYAKGVSVLMPGQAVPTFIAHPAPVPCPPEPISWPTHHQPNRIGGSTCTPDPAMQ